MKSHESDLLDLASCIYYDAAAKCAATPTLRDLKTMRSRVEHEGMSFLTITLPSLGQDFERSLDLGYIAPDCFRSFRKRLKTPAFLQGFFELVFDIRTGRILDEPDIAAIEGIRQMANSFKKLHLDCHPMRIKQSITGFVECEQIFERPIPEGDQDYFLNVSDMLWGDLVRRIDVLDCIPKHGPGATAEKISGNRKYSHRRWHDRLEPYFPLLSTAFTSVNAYNSKEFEKVSIVDEESEQPVRVITVPKTLKGPRVIAIEPVCMQYTQQAISRSLTKALERYRFTSGHVNFTDQTVNRTKAIMSSRSCESATLDMSSASDRVPYGLALSMFRLNPDLMGAIDACRSRRAQLPTGEIISLKKFASMGSALCFPVESMYFYTICVGALLRRRNLPVTSRNVYLASRDVFVYGDDIIVPTGEAAAVADDLQKYYCKVNMSKSFWTGKFRESCGMDAYDGEEVTPTYIRRMRPRNRQDAPELLSWVATSNLLYRKGYWKSSAHMRNVCEEILGKLPIVSDTASGLGIVSFQRCLSSERWSSRYHRSEVRAWVAKSIKRKDLIDGYDALTKCLLGLESRYSLLPGSQDDGHLVHSVRHGAVTLKRRWICPT